MNSKACTYIATCVYLIFIDFQDHLNEKLQRLGPQTPFGIFMANERSHMLEKSLRHIRTSLQV